MVGASEGGCAGAKTPRRKHVGKRNLLAVSSK
jgi:hypothetical protein